MQERDVALTTLVQERGAWLVRCAFLLARDHELALDLTQDTLLRAWRAWDKVSTADDPERYLLRIMLNLFRDHHRRREVPKVSIEDATNLDALVASRSREVGEDVADADHLAIAIERLSERQRAVIVLRYWVDYEDEAIAEVLGCRRATVRSIAARSLKIIQRHLDEDPS